LEYKNVFISESNWSEWTEWASCDMCTMRGLEERWRTCSYDDCEGDMLELRPTPESERVSMWSQWSEWASCDRCKTSDLEERVRSCVVGQCQGSPLELRYSLEETDQEVEAREQQSEDSDEESVWSEWSDWVQCDKCENEGIEERTRRCSSLDGCRGNPIELRFKNQPAPEENAYVIDPQSSNTERDLVYQQFDNHINMFYADTNSRPKQILASIKESSIEKDITKHEEEMASSDSFEVIEEVAYHHQPGVMARDDALSVKLKQILRRTPPLAARTQTRGETVLVVPHHHHTTNTSQTTDVVEFKTFYDHPNHIHKNQANSLSP